MVTISDGMVQIIYKSSYYDVRDIKNVREIGGVETDQNGAHYLTTEQSPSA